MSRLATDGKIGRKQAGIITGNTRVSGKPYSRIVDDIEYILIDPRSDMIAASGKPLNAQITKIIRDEQYAKNGDEPIVWIKAIQKVFDNHLGKIKNIKGFAMFHRKKVYFPNSKYDPMRPRVWPMYLSVQRKSKPAKKKAPTTNDSDDELPLLPNGDVDWDTWEANMGFVMDDLPPVDILPNEETSKQPIEQTMEERIDFYDRYTKGKLNKKEQQDLNKLIKSGIDNMSDLWGEDLLEEINKRDKDKKVEIGIFKPDGRKSRKRKHKKHKKRRKSRKSQK